MSSAGAAPRAAVPVSNARAAASRKNGAKSRGPKSPEGKARSARNALKHGLRAEKYLVLLHEDGGEFARLEAALVAELAPEGALQSVLARRVARAAWRLIRADRLEAEVFAERSYGAASPGLALIRDGNGTRSIETLLRYRGAARAELTRASNPQSAPGRAGGAGRDGTRTRTTGRTSTAPGNQPSPRTERTRAEATRALPQTKPTRAPTGIRPARPTRARPHPARARGALDAEPTRATEPDRGLELRVLDRATA
jgi:hypothetical protein